MFHWERDIIEFFNLEKLMKINEIPVFISLPKFQNILYFIN